MNAPSVPAAREGWLEWINVAGPLLGLALVYGLFCFIAPPSFRSTGNMETIVRQTAVVGTAALGMTMIMISGGIDLSVGSAVALSTVVIAWLLRAGVSPVWAGLGGVACGAACGCANGVLITRLRVVPFIVTLGMLLVLRGAAIGLAGQQKIDAPLTWLNEVLATLPPDRRWMLVPPGVWAMLLLAAVGVGLLRYTRLGRHVFAIGSNEETARLCGVPVNRVKVLVYTIGGAAIGLAGLMQFSRLTVGDPTVA